MRSATASFTSIPRRPRAHEELWQRQGAGIYVDREALVNEREGADASDLEARVTLGVAVAGHAHLLHSERHGEHFEVHLAVRGHHQERRFSSWRVLFDHERLVDGARQHARDLGDERGRTNALVEREDLVHDLPPFEEADGKRFGGQV